MVALISIWVNQAILVRLRSDLSEIFGAVARGGLGSVPVEWEEGASACVVLAARGYPERPRSSPGRWYDQQRGREVPRRASPASG